LCRVEAPLGADAKMMHNMYSHMWCTSDRPGNDHSANVSNLQFTVDMTHKATELEATATKKPISRRASGLRIHVSLCRRCRKTRCCPGYEALCANSRTLRCKDLDNDSGAVWSLLPCTQYIGSAISEVAGSLEQSLSESQGTLTYFARSFVDPRASALVPGAENEAPAQP